MELIDKAKLLAEIKRRILEDYNTGDKEKDAVAQGAIASLKYYIEDTLEVKEVKVKTKTDTLISDCRKANRAKFIKELKQKIDSYERELAKSSDSQKCDDVDWVMLSSDMFDMLQKCLLNF